MYGGALLDVPVVHAEFFQQSDRRCQKLPCQTADASQARVDQFWYKYAYMEELLANYAGCL